SGCSTSGPSSGVTALTGGGWSVRPGPAGRSGCVTTPTTSCPSPIRARSDGIAKSGVPQNSTLTIAPRGSLSLQLLPPVQQHLSLERADPIDEEDSVKVVDLVLERSGEEPRGLDPPRLPVPVQPLHHHRRRPLDDFPQARDAQAPLLAPIQLLARLHDLGIDE